MLTIALTLIAILALAAAELWLFWWLGERDYSRRRLGHAVSAKRSTPQTYTS
jgi:hypothetical protein